MIRRNKRNIRYEDSRQADDFIIITSTDTTVSLSCYLAGPCRISVKESREAFNFPCYLL